MGQPPYIDPHLLASKSTSSSRHRGILCEKLALVHFLNLGYQLIEKNYKTRICEVDLILENKHEVLLVEVKSKPGSHFQLQTRVSRKQAQKINHALLDYRRKTSKALRAHLAVVSQSGGVDVYEDFLCDLLW